ncbi:DNA sulfur modification protein DndD [Anaerovirgula multivorans]|uniref:Nuclease SbcCD subunit C n=1 Tax=Anaerovirgula multivorans TaxID=312168 RepID=A0A239CL24_9FIRM|nr:DNA sulfur modification protein DndD [Anaerovirgula multivorans]SNS20408.1 DNA sulfur modification protein DndD [Anaerovirgula multivorans]
MIINNITITNFGIYSGSNYYDFKVDKDKNIILINGKNGSGKTTLLNAIKLSLYGPYFLGYQAYNDKYFEYVHSKLNAFALNRENEDFSISICISFWEKGNLVPYTITRKWFLEKEKLTEELVVTKNQKSLDLYGTHSFLNSIHSSIPPLLFDVFFFDGEKIEKLFLLKNGSREIFGVFDTIFNLDLFKTLKLDLRKYLKQKNIYSSLSEQERNYTDLISEHDHIIDAIENQEKVISLLTEETSSTGNKLSNLEAEFQLIGGLQEQESIEIQLKIDKLNKTKQNIANKNKMIISEYLPFLIIRETMRDLVQELENEKTITEDILISNKLKDDSLVDHLANDQHYNVDRLKELLSSISDYFEKSVTNTTIYNLANSDFYFIENLLTEIDTIEDAALDNYFKQIKKYNDQLLELNKELELSRSKEITEKMLEIKEINSAYIMQKERLVLEQEKLCSLQDQLATIKNEVEKIQQQIMDSKKDENVFNIISKIHKVIDEYTRQTTSIKLTQLEQYVTEIFKTLIRKDDFIQKIEIDKTTGQIYLINSLGMPMPEDNLSAGEKQIYILSLLWGMLQVSGRKIPLVFDTLLGRLDKSHKSNIVKNFLHTCGEQVIILATDSEIDDEYNDLLSPYVSQNYKIDFDTQSKSVKIKNEMKVIDHAV